MANFRRGFQFLMASVFASMAATPSEVAESKAVVDALFGRPSTRRPDPKRTFSYRPTGRSCYQPHQGKRECARRVRQMQKISARRALELTPGNSAQAPEGLQDSPSSKPQSPSGNISGIGVGDILANQSGRQFLVKRDPGGELYINDGGARYLKALQYTGEINQLTKRPA